MFLVALYRSHALFNILGRVFVVHGFVHRSRGLCLMLSLLLGYAFSDTANKIWTSRDLFAVVTTKNSLNSNYLKKRLFFGGVTIQFSGFHGASTQAPFTIEKVRKPYPNTPTKIIDRTSTKSVFKT